MPEKEPEKKLDRIIGATCRWCNEGTYDPGFLEDQGERSSGFLRWVAGLLSIGIMGNARGLGRAAKFTVMAYRCDKCGHLDLFAEKMLIPAA